MFFQQLINGLMLGAAYTLITMALSLVVGVLGVFNIAVADVFMVAAFVGLTLSRLGLPVPIILVAAMVAGGLVSLVIERFGYRPLRHAHGVMPLLSTLGFAMILQNSAANIWGAAPSRFPDHLFAFKRQLGPVLIASTQVWILAVVIVLVLALTWVVGRTRLGRQMRAVAENPAAAVVLGVDITGVQRLTFFLSGLLAGAAGLLVGLNYGIITPYIGLEIGMKAIAVLVLGGVASLWGALVAGPILGVAQVMTAAYLSNSYQDIVIWGILLLVLILRPQGLFGRAVAVGRRI